MGCGSSKLVHEATITNSVQNSQEVDYDSQELPAHDTPAHSPAEKDWLSEIEEFVKTETRPSWYNNAVNAAEKAKLKELSPYEKAGNRAINEDVEQSSTDALEDLILLGYLEKLQ